MSLSKHLKEASLIVSLEQMEKTLNERDVLIEKGMSKFDADSEVKKSLVNKIYKNLFEELNDIKISANLPVETYKEKNILTIKKINTFYDKKIEDINKKNLEVVSEVEEKDVLEVEDEVEEKKAPRKTSAVKKVSSRKISKKNIIQIKKTLENLTRELVNKKR